MATPVILNASQLNIDPSCNVLKAEDYAIYLESQEILESAHQQAVEIINKAKEAYQREKERGAI